LDAKIIPDAVKLYHKKKELDGFSRSSGRRGGSETRPYETVCFARVTLVVIDEIQINPEVTF